jgi:ABC-type transporter MlaC component
MTVRSLLAVALVLAPMAAQAGEPDARQRTESFVAAFKKVKPDNGKLSKADREANAKAFAELDGYLDGEYFTDVSIKPIASKLSAGQAATFKSKFWEVVQMIAYPNSGDFFRQAKLTIGQAKEKGDVQAVSLKAELPKEDLETVVEFHWKKGPKGLRVVDVLFDGDSLVRDYQNQFARIVEKKGPEGLLKALEDKRAELLKAKGAK